MRTAARKFLIFFLLITITGSQWAVLQSVAWLTMLATNLRTQSVPEAVSETFDGQHPCPMCKAIAQGKKSEKKSEFVAHFTHVEFPPLDCVASLPWRELSGFAICDSNRSPDTLKIEPSTPPPRGLHA